jgi:amino acid transporter
LKPSFFYSYICNGMYLFRKKDPNRPSNINLKIMHVINAIAITVFVTGVLWKLIDLIFLK